MHYVLFASKNAAMIAADEWQRNIREDWWDFHRSEVTNVTSGLVQPCDRPRLSGTRLEGITIRASGPFARYGQRNAGMASSTFAAAWEAPL